MDTLGDRDHGCDTAQDCRRAELGMDQRRRQDAEEPNRKQPARHREYPSSMKPLCETRDGELGERNEEGVEDEEESNRARAGACMRFHERRQDVQEQRVADDDEYEVYGHNAQEPPV